MKYQATISNGVAKVVSPRTGAVYSYPVPPGPVPRGYALRCAAGARVAECLAAIRDVRGHRPLAGRPRRRGA